MDELLYIRHGDISRNMLKEICDIKSSAWPFNLKSQLEWIATNIAEDDIHVLLKANDAIVAYLSLRVIDICINDEVYKGYGIGSVCSRIKRNGFGTKIIVLINRLLYKNHYIGLLFCKKNLLPFYSNLGWKQIEKTNLDVFFDNTNIETLIFSNIKEKIVQVRYEGALL